ncbi:ImmA/IrrE family metallo-endopeptidase [Bacteroidales bacterium OttesenSCG-928-C19]|nr:ImmA/IrrE family metallo-endopeptidase [Bacteroidales bacterium OttesenSCG-928-C19]
MSASTSDNKALLAKYLPIDCVDNIFDLIVEHNVRFKIVNKRTSKLGDYLFLPPNKHRITINNNLNPYQFLFVTLHEFAHLKTFETYKQKRLAPHGNEWKAEFRALLLPYLSADIFPPDLNAVLFQFIKNPSATSAANAKLLKCFQKYNSAETDEIINITRVEDVPVNGLFRLNNRIFRKIGKRRTRYTCELVSDKRIYLVHGLAEVELIAVEN